MLQVITGIAKGRKLKVPKGQEVRPTTGRVKKAIFDILGDVGGKRVLDLFAGSGGLGIEAISRGAKESVFIDKSLKACEIIAENLTLCGFSDRASIICEDYKKALRQLKDKGKRFELILADPPYRSFKEEDLNAILDEAEDLMEKDALLVIGYKRAFRVKPLRFTYKSYPYGDATITFLRRKER